MSVVGKVFCKGLNNRLVTHLDKGRALHEGQAGFMVKVMGTRSTHAPSAHTDCHRKVYTQNSLAGQTLTQGERVWGHLHSKVVQSCRKNSGNLSG